MSARARTQVERSLIRASSTQPVRRPSRCTFLKLGRELLRLQLRKASSLRSIARFSNIYGLKSNDPGIRQPQCLAETYAVRVLDDRLPRLGGYSPAPKPCSVGLRKRAALTVANCCSLGTVERNRSAAAHIALMPPISFCSPFHLTTNFRATSTMSSPHPRDLCLPGALDLT